MNIKELAIALSILTLVGCSTEKAVESSATAAKQEVVASTENIAAVSLDWAGIYNGTLPCADCSGIKTTLTLNQNHTFELAQTYLEGKKAKNSDTITGNFKWVGTKPVVELEAKSGAIYYMIGEGYAKKFDTNGNPIDSKLNYTLQQDTVFDAAQ